MVNMSVSYQNTAEEAKLYKSRLEKIFIFQVEVLFSAPASICQDTNVEQFSLPGSPVWGTLVLWAATTRELSSKPLENH